MPKNTSIQKVEQQQNDLKRLIVSQGKQIALALPKHLTSDRLMRGALTAVSKTPKLAECVQTSVLGSIIQAAQLGLEPDGALGHAYLVPFWNSKKKTYECQLIVGYRGMLDIAGRSGRVSSISARVVREMDHFDYAYGLNERLEHRLADGERGKATHVYAVAQLVGGGHQMEVLTIRDIEKTMESSSGYQAYMAKKIFDTPWVSNWDDMARKTAARKLFKWLPVSIEMQRAVGLDDMAESGQSQRLGDIIDAELVLDDEPEPKTNKDKLKKQLKEQNTPSHTGDSDIMNEILAVAREKFGDQWRDGLDRFASGRGTKLSELDDTSAGRFLDALNAIDNER